MARRKREPKEKPKEKRFHPTPDGKPMSDEDVKLVKDTFRSLVPSFLNLIGAFAIAGAIDKATKAGLPVTISVSTTPPKEEAKHTAACGTMYRGCSPDCQYQKKQEAEKDE